MTIVETFGSDAPSREAELAVSVTWRNSFQAYYAPGFCNCGECQVIVGEGDSDWQAKADYWDKWQRKYGRKQ